MNVSTSVNKDQRPNLPNSRPAGEICEFENLDWAAAYYLKAKKRYLLATARYRERCRDACRTAG